jgi:hypothetical protein
VVDFHFFRTSLIAKWTTPQFRYDTLVNVVMEGKVQAGWGVGLRIVDCGFIGLFSRGHEIEIESFINQQSAICNPQSAIRNPQSAINSALGRWR